MVEGQVGSKATRGSKPPDMHTMASTDKFMAKIHMCEESREWYVHVVVFETNVDPEYVK